MRRTRSLKAVVVANLDKSVYVLIQVRDPALDPTTSVIALEVVVKFPGETLQGVHEPLKKVNSDDVFSIAHSART